MPTPLRLPTNTLPSILVWVGILSSVLLSLHWLYDGNLLFHNDIARDLYLLKDIWDNKNPTLIGARAGGLTGWFHGPLWLYLNLPAFIIGRGSPLAVGWFWFLLHLLTLALIYFVSRKVFDRRTALVTLLIYSSATILSLHGYLNPQGALILFPVFFYFYWQYKKTARLSCLTAALFVAGCLIQFQIAFGAPILILTLIDSVHSTLKDRQISRLFSYLILLIPLSSYILFDLRHDFLLLKSVSHLSGSTPYPFAEKISTLPIWFWLGLPLILIKKRHPAVSLFLYYYLGFWLITFLFNIRVMDYYYLPFLPVLVMIGSSLLIRTKPYILITVVSTVFLFNINHAFRDNQKYSPNVNFQDWSTWKSVQAAALWALDNCTPGSGIFVYTADLYGYNLRYALEHHSRLRGLPLQLDQKMPVTCLLLGPNVSENPHGSDNWKSGDLKINQSPVQSMVYGNGIRVEKYHLDQQSLSLPPNPYLIKDAFFR